MAECTALNCTAQHWCMVRVHTFNKKHGWGHFTVTQSEDFRCIHLSSLLGRLSTKKDVLMVLPRKFRNSSYL